MLEFVPNAEFLSTPCNRRIESVMGKQADGSNVAEDAPRAIFRGCCDCQPSVDDDLGM